jgi:hypothetical protein
VPDTYAALASNISPQCGSKSNAPVPWDLSLRLPPPVSPIIVGGRTEYHICGDLTLSGIGAFAPLADTNIVIENGSLIIEDKASVSIARTAVILTGDNNYPSKVEFPKGNGKSASLTLSPPLDVSNPWQGVALFQDPKLTNNVDNKIPARASVPMAWSTSATRMW